jgi:hypothetical protein|tara:strand:- start:1446 stop:1649 length:204 start_codon:yes stop_codon:yes gene_type:complete
MVINNKKYLMNDSKSKTVSFVVPQNLYDEFIEISQLDIKGITPSMIFRSWIATAVEGKTILLKTIKK